MFHRSEISEPYWESLSIIPLLEVLVERDPTNTTNMTSLLPQLLWLRTLAEDEEQIEPRTAILFPWLVELIGILALIFLTRYVPQFPYTAAMFLLGTFMGMANSKLDNDSLLHQSIDQWLSINSELLLGVFLPGLIFKDALGLDFHLFTKGLSQIMVLAFPMVLAGTALTAMVAYYFFPYDWSFNLAMTFGSILSATDPVAVSALLNEVGAPPRLKVHISGESLLNDGSAIVFYTIFSGLYLFELGIEGLGEEVDVADGFALFFREAGGGAAMGIAFGLGLSIILFVLDRRLEDEENVVQVAATITIAYLTFFSADVSKMSGVMAVVLCGLTTQAFGSTMINDPKLMDNFWSLVEHLLNSLLFALGGTVWGSIIVPSDKREESFSGRDWGYLIVLYLLLNVIRYLLLFGVYPLTSRIGLSTNVSETCFSSFAGLRGAIGIALALSLDSEVREYTAQANKSFEFRHETNKVFGFVGGIALLTLVVNGVLSGPLLRKLGLADTTHYRQLLVENVHRTGVRHMYEDFIELLSHHRFRTVDFATVMHHIPDFQEMTLDNFRAALQRHKELVPPAHYKTPYILNVLPYLLNFGEDNPPDLTWTHEFLVEPMGLRKKVLDPAGEGTELSEDDKDHLKELRRAFISLLHAAYEKQIVSGELDGRDGFVAQSLIQGLDFACGNVSKGDPINDWEFSLVTDARVTSYLAGYLHRGAKKFKGINEVDVSVSHTLLRIEVHRALAFMKAHEGVRETFKEAILSHAGREFTPLEKLVLHESWEQVRKAEEALLAMDKEQQDAEVAHLFCIILLNKLAGYVRSLAESGILKPREAGKYNEEIEAGLQILTKYCSDTTHPDQLDEESKRSILSKFACVVSDDKKEEDNGSDQVGG